MNPLKRRSSVPLGFLDVLANFAMVLLIALVILIPFVNELEKTSDNEQKAVGNILVELWWDDTKNIDIDLWTLAPNDNSPVGFTRKNGVLFDLLRDDIGIGDYDFSRRNYEIQVGNNIIPGKYVVNVIFYGGTSRYMKTTVTVAVSLVFEGKSANQILARDIELELYQQKNVFVFELDDNLRLIKESVHIDNNYNLGKSAADGDGGP